MPRQLRLYERKSFAAPIAALRAQIFRRANRGYPVFRICGTARERPRLPLRRELARLKNLEARLREREREAAPEQ